ncbi:MAG: PEGA domain-containing protein [Paludibacter sp.]
MKKISKPISFFLACSILFASCTSTTLIQSNPSKAKLYLDGEFVGETPYQHHDSKIVGSSMTVKIEKDGYKPIITSITKDEEVDVGAVVGGLLIAVPFLWTMKYKPVHSYELKSLVPDTTATTKVSTQVQVGVKSKFDRLKELKQLLDEKIITQDEFEKQKQKILDEKE